MKGTARTTKGGIAFLLTFALAVAAMLAFSGNATASTGVPCAPTGMESVSTPRDHYQAGEVATISGAGYAIACDVQVDVERPDGVVESFTATTDLGGAFALDYQVPPPPGVLGQYRVVVRGLNGAELASTTFEDAPAPQFDVAPSHVKTTGSRTFSVLVRNVAGGSGDIARCVRVETGSNFDVTSWSFQVANPGTGAGGTGNWVTASGTNFVQIRNNENAPSGRGLLGQNLSDPNWVRFEITVNVQATGTQNWRTWMNTNGTADCTSGSSDELAVRAGGTFTRDYAMDFRDASGNVIAAPSTTSGGTVDYRARITRVNSGDDLSYAAIAAPTCLSNIAVVSVTDSGSPSFQAHVSDNFVRLVSSSSNPSFSGTKLAANGEWVQVHFTATAGCSSAQPFRSAAWKNTSPEAAEGDIYKLVPSVSINNVSLTEGNSGTKTFGFTVTLSHADDNNVTVNYATANGTAIAPSDYTAIPSTALTFAPGETTKTVNVTVNGDVLIEPDETFFVNLTSPVNAFIADNQGVGTILNDDNSLTIDDVTLTEGNSGTKSFNFTVTLSPPHTSTVTVQYATANGTATAGSDYVAHPTTTLTFTAGQMTKTVSVVVNGDTTDEADETFFVNLFNSTNATITDSQGVGTILNDENEAPVAADDSYSTDEDTPLIVPMPGVLGNDTDADGDPLTAALVDDVDNGTLVLESDGSFSYTPNANFNGSDSFTYKANDGTVDSNEATVTITVDAANDAPACEDVTLTTDEDTPGSASPDCSDVDGDSLTYEIVDQPAHGSAAVVGGELSYTPDANYNGGDSFTYRASDGTADSNTADVAVTVNAVNDAPACEDVTLETDEDTPGSTSPDCSDVDGDSLTYEVVDQPADGSAAVVGGELTYTPNPNFNGTDSFTYRAGDGTASSNTANVAVTVDPVNDAPTCEDVTLETDEDTPGSTSPDCSDVDGDLLTYEIVDQPANGSAAVVGGELTYTPEPNFNGADSFTYRASDGAANSNTADVSVTVNPVNDAPVAGNDTYTVDEDNTLDVPAPGVLGNDSDVDGDALEAELVTDVSHGTLTLNADGSFTYTPAANFNGEDSFTYKANDGAADSNVAAVTITVNAVNDAPTCANVALTTDEDTAGHTDPDCSDVDGDVLSYAIVDQPAHGTASVTLAGKLRYEPNANFYGTDSFTYRASDGLVNSNTADVAVTVNPVNDAPVANDDAYSTDEDETLTVPAPGVLGNDSDVEGDSLTAVLVSGPSHGSLALNADGSFTYTPDANYNGGDSFTYRANDGVDSGNVATVNITVNAVNDAPVAADDAYATDEDTALNVPAPGVLGNDGDVDGDSLEAELVSGVSHGSLTLNADGSFTYTPDANYHGGDSFTYDATDGEADSNVATVTIAVRSVNDAPNVSAGDDVSGAEGSAIALNGTVSDVENDDVTVQWTYTAGAGVDAGATCSFANPNAVDTAIACTDDGSYTATLTATDEHGAASSDSASVTVSNANPAVDIGSPNDETAPVAVNTVVNVASTFTDAGVNDTHTPPAGSCQINWGDGSTTAGTVTETPQSGSGSCSGSHAYTAAGVYTITVTVTDDDGGSGSDTAPIVIYDPNAGFVTGGGWITVQPGSYTADPSAAGKGTFGFVSKYKKGASTPEGQTEFNFQVAGFKFHSEAYKWLVVSGHKAQYVGTGRVNGESGYDFRLTAYDGQAGGGGGVDKFRLKITKNGVTVFDNRIAAPEHIDAADPQAIGGGQIVIHKG